MTDEKDKRLQKKNREERDYKEDIGDNNNNAKPAIVVDDMSLQTLPDAANPLLSYHFIIAIIKNKMVDTKTQSQQQSPKSETFVSKVLKLVYESFTDPEHYYVDILNGVMLIVNNFLSVILNAVISPSALENITTLPSWMYRNIDGICIFLNSVYSFSFLLYLCICPAIVSHWHTLWLARLMYWTIIMYNLVSNAFVFVISCILLHYESHLTRATQKRNWALIFGTSVTSVFSFLVFCTFLYYSLHFYWNTTMDKMHITRLNLCEGAHIPRFFDRFFCQK